ncbi:MAG: ATP-dependent Clp protease ATP-binding subunit ClpA, partial [Pseudomonadota bacterium]
EVVARVVDKFVLELEGQLAERDVDIELTEEARRWLATRGYDQAFGARPLARVIQENIKRPLADELLFGKLAKGGLVRVSIKDDKPVFDIVSRPPKGEKKPRQITKKPPKVPALVE